MKMNVKDMSTSTKIDREFRTDFVLHKSQQTIFNNIQKKIIDYSEHRLIKYIETISDAQQKLVLMAMLSDYISGHIAISWKRGKPTYIRVVKDTQAPLTQKANR